MVRLGDGLQRQSCNQLALVMESKKSTPDPQQTPSAEESATRRLKLAHSWLMEVQAEINTAYALLTPAITGTLPLEELHKVSCQLHHLLASMDRSLSYASFYCEEAVSDTSLALERCKRPYTSPAVGAVRGDR